MTEVQFKFVLELGMLVIKWHGSFHRILVPFMRNLLAFDAPLFRKADNNLSFNPEGPEGPTHWPRTVLHK